MQFLKFLLRIRWQKRDIKDDFINLPDAEGKNPIKYTKPACSSGELIEARCPPIATQFASAASNALSLAGFH